MHRLIDNTRFLFSVHGIHIDYEGFFHIPEHLNYGCYGYFYDLCLSMNRYVTIALLLI